MKIEKFTNRYKLSKTICFRLIPEGKTLEYIEKNGIIASDEKRNQEFKELKKLIDKYHKTFINETLSNFRLDYISEFSDIYYKQNKTPDDRKKLDKIAKTMRTCVSSYFGSQPKYKSLFNKDIVHKLLYEIVENDREKEILKNFDNFTTYLTEFNENRKNFYTCEGKTTEIAYRIVDENLPKYLNNCMYWKTTKEFLDKTTIDNLTKENKKAFSIDINDLFAIENYSLFLSQENIDLYNTIIGGYSIDTRTKKKGINELVNEYNQQNEKKIHKLDTLYKQILSNQSESYSYTYENFNTDQELLDSIKAMYLDKDENTNISVKDAIEVYDDLSTNFDDYNTEKIYIKNGQFINELSAKTTGLWSNIKAEIMKEYDKSSSAKDKNSEAYINKRNKSIKDTPNYSIKKLESYVKTSGSDEKSLTMFIKDLAKSQINNVKNLSQTLNETLKDDNYNTKALSQDDKTVELIKGFLDGLIEISRQVGYFDDVLGLELDNEFYSKLRIIKKTIEKVIVIYNKTRNYITKKPYSKEKIKINFDNPQFLNGWDKNKEEDYLSVIFRKDGYYFLGVINSNDKKIFERIPKYEPSDDKYEKLVYKQIPIPQQNLPRIFFSETNIEKFNPSKEIIDIYNKKTFISGENFNIKDCRKLIDFYKNNINNYGDWNEFGFSFSDTSTYMNISEFYNEVSSQGYKIRFIDVSKKYIDELVDNGKLYLFRLYNKDYSPYSKGTKNMHTLYFEMLFDENNIDDVVYKLDGSAEMFYRKSSVDRNSAVVHEANHQIKNKNKLNKKEFSTFEYDIIKDKRYTESQFYIHLPITINYKSNTNTKLNDDIRYELRNCENNKIIGIDRGERNLLYVYVIDETGKTLEQKSLNIINNNGYQVDYHSLLDSKESNRDKARKEWKTIENIKELKNGYISQAVHEVVKLVEKYGAIIALEDLNSGFKNSRTKFEKQVYQKFEKALIDKLNFLVNKKRGMNESGGLLHAYQLTNKFDSFKKMGYQNGIMFYVPAWLTSKIDPTTGFVNLLHPKYKNIEESKKYINNFDAIKYNKDEDMFVFDIDYDKFERGSIDFKKRWSIYTNGDRIKTFRNPEKNNEWDSVSVNITEEFKKLFRDYKLDYFSIDLKREMLNIAEKVFFEKLFCLLSLTLQMRNSKPKTEIDYIISPVKNKDGKFYFSNDYDNNSNLPSDADANGAYHIALKALWFINKIKNCNEDEINKAKLSITNLEWLKFVQTK